MAKKELLEKALSEVNKCNPNSPDYLSKFLKYYSLFEEVHPECIRGYNLGSPYARPDPKPGGRGDLGGAIKLRHIRN